MMVGRGKGKVNSEKGKGKREKGIVKS